MRKRTRALALSTVAALVALSVTSSPVASAAGVAPQVLIFQITEAQATSISFTVSVVPGGSTTTIVLDYGTTPALGSATAPQSIGDGSGPVTLTQTIYGLKPNTAYFVDFVASNAVGSAAVTAGQILTAPTTSTPPATSGTSTSSSTPPGPGTQPVPLTWSVERLARPTGKIAVVGSGSGVVEMLLSSVACASPTHCVAVGSDPGLRGILHPLGPLVEVRKGARWSIPAIHRTSSLAADELSAVSCPSSSLCTAVVSSVGSSAGGTTPPHPVSLVETGGAWKFERLPTFPASLNVVHAYGSSVTLSGVSCTSASFCMAVGEGGSKSSTGGDEFPFADVERGANWHLVLPPKPASGQSGSLSGVSCSSPADCVAVGSLTPSGAPLIEKWNGARWSTQAYPRSASGRLLGVSCSSPSACVAVGEGGARDQGLVMSRHLAEWRVEPGALLARGSFHAVLTGVSCRSPSACVAVGFDQRQTGQAPLVERGAGQSWTSEELPRTAFASAIADSSLSSGHSPLGVSCASATSCTVVGLYATRASTALPIAATTTI